MSSDDGGHHDADGELDPDKEIDLSEAETASQKANRLRRRLEALPEDDRLLLAADARSADPVGAAAEEAGNSGRRVVARAKEQWESFFVTIYSQAFRDNGVVYILHQLGLRPDQQVRLAVRLAELVEAMSRMG